MIKALVFALSGSLLAVSAAMAAGDPAAGEKVFQACAACHSVGPGASNKIGPELNGLIGRAAGTAPGYRYSSAMKSSGLTWDEATFARYIADPRGVVPGNKMSFAGLSDPTAVADITAYLSSFNADGSKKSP